ncbi:Aspartate-semialdehyde dehydrogenase [compost metagenome]
MIQDDPKNGVYPMARDVSGKDPVYVGRIHRDPENPLLWLMWVVSDNVRKGAALNGIQIAEKIFP